MMLKPNSTRRRRSIEHLSARTSARLRVRVAEITRRRPEAPAERASEMRGVVEPPGERDLADAAVGVAAVDELGPASLEAPGEDGRGHRALVVGEEQVQ